MNKDRSHKRQKECPYCKISILSVNHVKHCSNKDSDYRYKYLIYNYPELTKETLDALYNKEFYSLPMISKKFNIDLKSICYLLSYYGYKTRSISDSLKTDEHRNRRNNDNLKRYGAINALSKNTKSYHKRNATVKERYGCDNVFQVLDRFIDYRKASHSNKSKISSLNRELYKILDRLDVEFIPEFSLRYHEQCGKNRWKSFDAKVGNLLIEINGNYWHANPLFYEKDDVFTFPRSIQTAGDIWERDKIKHKIANDAGYEVLCIWESDLKKDFNNVVQKIKDKIDTLNT